MSRLTRSRTPPSGYIARGELRVLIPATLCLFGVALLAFDDAHSPRTLAFFSEPGDYVVQLIGTDSLLENMTEVKVVVSR